MDPIKKVRPGERLQIPARAWNRVLDTLGPNLGYAAGASAGVERASNIVLVRNDSGMNLPACAVLGISGVAISPVGGTLTGTDAASARARSFFERPALTGIVPSTADHSDKFVVTLEPIAAGAIGRAAAGGVFACKVQVNDIFHNYATVKGGDPLQLQSSACGLVQLLWREVAGSDSWAVGVM
jgi:hypothetical protein